MNILSIISPNPSYNLTTYFPLLLTLTPLVLFWQQSKAFISKILRVFWKKRTIDNYDLFNIAYKKLNKNSLNFNFDDYTIQMAGFYSLSKKVYLNGFFKVYQMEIFLYKYFIPLLIKNENDTYNLYYLKFTFNFDKFFNECLEEYYNIQNEPKEIRYNNFRIEEIRGMNIKTMGFSKDSGTELKGTVATTNTNNTKNGYVLYPCGIKNNQLHDRLFYHNINQIEWNMPKNQPKNKYIFTQQGNYVLNQTQRWLDSEAWYMERNIPYRRGILLNGQPGTGKSSLVLEIAKKLGLPIFIVDLSTFSNQEFCEKMDTISGGWAGIILIEDIDNIFNGRNNINKSDNYGGLTFDCLLNKLSGIKSIKNKFIFITTNHLEKVDGALLRPGRCDEIVKLESLNSEQKLKMATTIIDDSNVINKVINEGVNDSTAEFENRCTIESLNKFWNK